ncbi:hypothetical protein [Limosilactobacillus caecicola]|uniref:hypothetical protein n=1 Tax=Limosilactobacillus caecicola TaxID=2941332 RepID=UPI0020404D7F|nr:hypothetical protein [Limosilactobacillus caecicola]
MKLLPPQELQMVLDQSPEYRQARKLLRLDIDEDPNRLYHQPVNALTVRLARTLQTSNLIQGRVDLSDYRSVSQLVGQHDRWFSGDAKRELLKPFE